MGKRLRFGRTIGLAALVAGLCLAAGTADAAQLVTFTRGQSIVVQSAEKRGAWYYFVLDGGGEMGVPLKQVASIEEYEAPPPSSIPAVAAAPIAPPVAAPLSQEAPQAALPQPDSGNPTAQRGEPGTEPPPSQPNVATQGNDDWRYKVRMSGGPRQGMQNPYGAAGPGARGGGRLPLGIMKPGTQRPYPPQQQTPQN